MIPQICSLYIIDRILIPHRYDFDTSCFHYSKPYVCILSSRLKAILASVQFCKSLLLSKSTSGHFRQQKSHRILETQRDFNVCFKPSALCLDSPVTRSSGFSCNVMLQKLRWRRKCCNSSEGTITHLFCKQAYFQLSTKAAMQLCFSFCSHEMLLDILYHNQRDVSSAKKSLTGPDDDGFSAQTKRTRQQHRYYSEGNREAG